MIRPLIAGQAAPWFNAPALDGNPRYAFDTAAGRWVLMLFAGSAGDAAVQEAWQAVSVNRDLFDDARACFFGVSTDPADAVEGRIAQQLPGIRWFLDYDRELSELYGACRPDASGDYDPNWVLLDPMLRLAVRAPLADGHQVLATLRQLLEVPRTLPAPVLMVPNILSLSLCRRLIEGYHRHGGKVSGFMRDVGGVTRELVDPSHKSRSDWSIEDSDLKAELNARLFYVLKPLVQRAFQCDPTRIERWLVACYDAEAGGHFRPHRDNTTMGTAHRKFAVTINLDTSSYEGGDLCFPEFSNRLYRAPTGGAIVFSCSLLHEARPVTRGKRYAFLPFLYDDEGARIRERNIPHVAAELQGYRSGLNAPD